MEEPLIMYSMYGEETIAKVIVYDKTVTVENYSDDWVIRPFGIFENPSYEQFKNWLEKRCFPKTRHNCKELLKSGGISYYNPLEIIKKTHGAMVDDLFWIKFEGEDLNWNDINPRKRTLEKI